MAEAKLTTPEGAMRNIDSIKAAVVSPSPSTQIRTIDGKQVGAEAVEEAAAKLATADLLEAPAIDEAEATKAMGSSRMFAMMSKKFGATVAAGVSKIEAAFGEQDFEALEIEANNLKGSSKIMAAKRLCAAATQLQHLCRPESLLEVETGATEPEALLADVQKVIAELGAAAAAVQDALTGGGGGGGAAEEK